MAKIPSSWTIYNSERWPPDSTNKSLDAVDEAAVAPLPRGRVILKYILLLGCDYDTLTRLNPERFPHAPRGIIGAPAVVYRGESDTTDVVAILSPSQWKSAAVVGEFMRDRVIERDAHLLVNTSADQWLLHYSRYIMSNRLTSGDIALDSARAD